MNCRKTHSIKQPSQFQSRAEVLVPVQQMNLEACVFFSFTINWCLSNLLSFAPIGLSKMEEATFYIIPLTTNLIALIEAFSKSPQSLRSEMLEWFLSVVPIVATSFHLTKFWARNSQNELHHNSSDRTLGSFSSDQFCLISIHFEKKTRLKFRFVQIIQISAVSFLHSVWRDDFWKKSQKKFEPLSI